MSRSAPPLGQRLADEKGIPTTEYQQNQRSYNRPMRELEAMVYAREIMVDANPVTEWCFANTVVNANAKEEVMPGKQAKKADAKIDAVQTHCMALQMATDIEPAAEGEIDFLY